MTAPSYVGSVPFFAFFLLRDMPSLITLAMNRLPPQHVETSVAVWRELNGVAGRYIRGVVLDGLVVAVLAALGLWAVRVPFTRRNGGATDSGRQTSGGRRSLA